MLGSDLKRTLGALNMVISPQMARLWHDFDFDFCRIILGSV